MDGKTIQCLPNPSQHVPIYLQSFRVIRCLSKCLSPKIAIFTIFLFSLGRPWDNHATCCIDGRMVGLPDGEKIENICNGLDTIPACDGQTDGQTSCHGIYALCIYASRSNNNNVIFKLAACLFFFLFFRLP